MGITDWLTQEEPEIGSPVVGRSYVDRYGVQTATLMRVDRIVRTWDDGVSELDVTYTEDGDDIQDLAWSDEVYVVASGC